ncbi:hypothetical protein C7B77_17860, partial [Chamaesiphon polymorphus CCALA 037]
MSLIAGTKVMKTSIAAPIANNTNVNTINTRWYAKLNRSHIVRVLELVQDTIAISLCIGLFCVMVLQL